MDPTVPPLPPGFQLDSSPSASATPPPPPGFELDSAPQTGTIEVPSSTPSVGGVVRQGITGVNEGINKGLSIFDPVAKLGNAAGNVVRGVIGKEPVTLPTPSEAFAHQFVEPGGQPDNGLERAVRMGGDLAGQTLPLAAGIGGIANSGARAVVGAEPTIVNALKGAYNQILDFAAANPARAAITGETGAFQSGAGGQTARDVAKDSGVGPQGQNLAEAAGQMFTPMAVAKYMQFSPTAMIGKTALKGAQKAIGFVPTDTAAREADELAYANREGKYADPNVPAPDNDAKGVLGPIKNAIQSAQDAGYKARAASAQNTVGKEFNQVLQRPEAAANLDESNQLEKDIPGFNPGVAKATGDPALLNLQQDIGAKSVGSDLRNAQSQTDNSARSIRDYLESIVPPVATNAPGEELRGKLGLPPDVKTPPQDIVAKSVAGRVNENTKAIGQQAADTQTAAEQRRASLQSDLEQQGNETQAAIAARQKALQDSLEQQGTDTQSQIEQRQTALRTQAEADQATAQGKLKATSESLPETDPTQVGNYLRDTRASLKKDADVKVGQLRNAIDPNGESQVSIGKDTDGNPIYVKIGQILDARTRILQELRNINSASAKSPSDMARRDTLNGQLTNLNQFTDNLRLPDAGMQARFDAYRNYYKNEYVPRFSEGASRDVGRYDQFGYDKSKVDAEDVPGAFFKPNNISEARQFNKLYGDNPQARQQMTDYALDDLRRTGTDPTSGLLKDGAIAKWLAKNERVLNEMPWVRDAVLGKDTTEAYGALSDAQNRAKLAGNPKTAGQLDSEIPTLQSNAADIAAKQKLAGNVKTAGQLDSEIPTLQSKAEDIAGKQKLASSPNTAGQLDPELNGMYERFGDLEQRQRAVADTKVAGLLGKNPERQIDAGLNDWQVMRGLKRSVAGDPQAEQALTRAVWERATAAGGTDTLLDPAKLQSWIDGHKRALGEVLTPEHMGALQKVIKAATIEGRLPRPKGAVDQPGTLADKAAGATGLSMQGYLSRALNVAKGYMSKEYAAADIAARVWHNMAGKEVDAAWREALSNPKVAQNLANMTSGKPTAPQMKRLKIYLLTAGVADTSNQAETGDLPHK